MVSHIIYDIGNTLSLMLPSLPCNGFLLSVNIDHLSQTREKYAQVSKMVPRVR